MEKELERWLKDLANELSAAGSESTAIEIKRDWWRLTEEHGKREFARDVSSMCNALEASDEPRRIVIGLKSNGQFNDSPMPRDESELQQLLSTWIEPTPHVAFRRATVNGLCIYVVELAAPFDRPYLCKQGAEWRIYVRLGSTTVTPTRRMLDRMYRAKERSADLKVTFSTGDEASAVYEPNLILPKPLDPAQTALSRVRKLMAELHETRRSASADGKATVALDALEERARSFLSAMDDSTVRRSYNLRELWESHSRMVRLQVANVGDGVARGVRLVLEGGEWLHFSNSSYFDAPYRGPEPIRHVDLMDASVHDGLISVPDLPKIDSLALQLSALSDAFRNIPIRYTGPQVFSIETLDMESCVNDEGDAVIDVGDVVHAHSSIVQTSIRAVLLPGAPDEPSATLRVFHVDLPDYVECPVVVCSVEHD